MSSLYVKLKTGFYSNRKTARLRHLIGDDAFWIPPRLWAYAVENQPDGNLSSYTSEELAELLGCYKYASSILDALKGCGFVDLDGFIHDWETHAGYHKAYAERAKAAAEARWAKKKEPKKKDKEIGEGQGDKHCLAHACSIYEAYPRKVGRPAALKAIQKALVEFAPEFLLERTKIYASARNGQDMQFTPHPATWFNQQRFNDDPALWKPNTTSKHVSATSAPDRNAGTHNAGRIGQYDNIGKVR